MRTIGSVENVVCSAETMSGHPELFHYTRPEAFAGIVGSNTLWCSHYRAMDDLDEVLLMRRLLPGAVEPRMDAIAGGLNRHMRRIWKRAGGGAKTSLDFVNSLYGATYDGRASYSRLDPYLFSFSTHADDSIFDRTHGIRSQWESYAGPDGYCLVFDIHELALALANEMDSRYWARLTLDPVRYADRPVDEVFPELVDASAETFRRFVMGDKYPEMAVPEFLSGTTLLKAASYKTEREVRIVAIPGTARMASQAGREYPAQFDASLPLPVIRTRPDGRPYVALFDSLGLRLPIKRVIVGPGAMQHERAKLAERLLGSIPVSLSETVV